MLGVRQRCNGTTVLPKGRVCASKIGTQRNVIACFGGYSSTSGFDGPSVVSLVGQLASAAAWAGVAYLGYQLKLQQDDAGRRGDKKECETCGGTGVVDCICTRWSDGDQSGCGGCRGTRQMACSSCGGGGMAVPIEAKVYIKRESDYLNR